MKRIDYLENLKEKINKKIELEAEKEFQELVENNTVFEESETESELEKRFYASLTKMVIILIAVLVLTYAWFINNYDVSIGQGDDTLSIKMPSFQQLEISTDGGKTWSSTAEIEMDPDFTLYKEVTSDGINFYIANAKDEEGQPINFIPAKSGEDYLELHILFKGARNSEIFLDNTSKVYPADGAEPDQLINSDIIVRKSASGDFSRDLIAGAVRVAFVPDILVDGELVSADYVSFVWAPNKGYQVKNIDGELKGFLDSTEEQNYSFLRIEDPYTFHEESFPSLIFRDEIKASMETGSTNGDPAIARALKDNNDGSYIGGLTIKVWVEGNDRESIYALKGGIFRTYLSFLGVTFNS